MNPETMNSTNYNEEEAVNAVIWKRANGQVSQVSVMNAALPAIPLVDEKRLLKKRLREDVEYSPEREEIKKPENVRRQRSAKLNHAYLSKSYTPNPKSACLDIEKSIE